MNKEEKVELVNNDKPKAAPKEKKSRKGIASISFLIAVFDFLGELIYNALVNGFFGKIFSSYSYLETKFKESLVGKVLFGNHTVRKFSKRVRGFLARNIETGFFVNNYKRLIKYFCSLSLSSYGNFLMFFGIYTIVVYLLKMLLPGIGTANIDYLIVGIVMMLTALPMCFSKTPLVKAVKLSVFGNMIFQGAFGFSEEAFESNAKKTRGKGNFMFLLGLLAGVLTFVVSPLKILLVILAALLVCIIAVAPEIGVILSVVLLPFLRFFETPTVILSVLVLCTAFFYLLKVIRGKRVFKLEILDVSVLLFGILVMLSSLFSAGGSNSFSEASITAVLIMVYFLLANMMRTTKWIKRCVYALIGSAAVVALVGVLEYFIADGNSQWLDVTLFSNIKMRVVSLFENPNILSVFLVMVFPFVLATGCLVKERNEKRLCWLIGMLLTVCTVFTWSRGAWIAIIVGSFAFFIIYTKKTFRIFGVLIFAIPVLPMIVPDNVINRFLSITNLSDSSIAYRIYTWKGTLNMIQYYLFGGIGYGNEAFQSIYPNYSYSGMESAAHSHSLFLQIIAYMGIFGIIVFALIMFLYFQKGFEYLRRPENVTSKLYVAAAMASIIAALVMGIFDYIWYNYRVMYVFWLIMAIGCAFVRVGETELHRQDISSIDY